MRNRTDESLDIWAPSTGALGHGHNPRSQLASASTTHRERLVSAPWALDVTFGGLFEGQCHI